MPLAFHGDDRNKVYCSLVLLSTVIASYASFIMIRLIRRVNQWSGFTYLIYLVACLQLLYDVSFFNMLINVNVDAISIIADVCGIFSSLSVDLLTNVIGGITLYVVARKHSFDLLYYIPHIFLCITMIGFTVVLLFFLSIFGSHNSNILIDLHDTMLVFIVIRSGSLILNVIFAVITFGILVRLGSFQSQTPASKALRAFGMRLFLYPIVQVLSRVTRLAYDIKYGYHITGNHYGFDYNPEHTSDLQFRLQCLIAITMPIASIGYLCIFIVMQPKAYPVLLQMLKRYSLMSVVSGSFTSEGFLLDDDSSAGPTRNSTKPGSHPRASAHLSKSTQSMYSSSQARSTGYLSSHGRNTHRSTGGGYDRSTMNPSGVAGNSGSGSMMFRMSSLFGWYGQPKSCTDFMQFLEEDLLFAQGPSSIGMTPFAMPSHSEQSSEVGEDEEKSQRSEKSISSAVDRTTNLSTPDRTTITSTTTTTENILHVHSRDRSQGSLSSNVSATTGSTINIILDA